MDVNLQIPPYFQHPLLQRHSWLSWLLVVFGYALLAWIGLQVPPLNGHVSLIWPATGFVIAVLWRLGMWYGTAIAVGVVLVTQLQHMPLATSIGVALGNTLGPALAVWMMNRRRLRFQLDSPHDMVWFLVYALGVGTVLSALNGACQLWSLGIIAGDDLFSTAVGWWFGDGFGVIVFGIPLLCFNRKSWQDMPLWLFVQAQLAAWLSAVVLFTSPDASNWSPSLLFLPLLVLLWSVFHLNLWATAVAVAIIACTAVLGTVAGLGMFAGYDPLEALFGIASYVLVISTLSYLLIFLLQNTQNTRGRINSALEGSALGIWDLDLQVGRVQFYGQAEQMLGYEPGELGARFTIWSDLLHPADRESARHALVQHLKGETPLYQCEFRLQHKDGGYRWIFSQGRVIERDFSNKALRLVGSNADISRLKQADLAVADLRDFYATILSKVVTGVWVGDASHKVIYANSGLCHLLQQSQDYLLGRHLLNDFPQVALEQFRPHYYRAQQALTPVRFDNISLQIRDRTLYISGWLVPLLKDGHYDGMIGTIDDMTQQRVLEQQMRELAFTDQLTQLPNRAGLAEQSRELFLQAIQHQRSLAMFYIDLDHFQHINDTMGHHTGDELLQQVATRLRAVLHGSDVLGRLGGDEFLLIRESQLAGDVANTALQLTNCMNESFVIGERRLQISPSIGVAMFPQHGLTFAELLRAADVALYAAKDAGRHCHSVYSHQMSEQLHERLQLEHGMRTGLAQGQFSLHFQPILHLDTQQVALVEVLLRWHHPQLGAVSPVRFIPLAEQSGFINTLGAWVLQQACQQAARWLQQGNPLRIAVNISTVQLTQANFLSMLTSTLEQTGLPAGQLELELTESVMAQEVGASRVLLQQIRNLGVSLALDDFGTGYSSLAYLKSFPMDKLKIDRSFVQDMLSDPDDRAIMHAMVVLGHSLGMQVVAEGIEDAAQLSELRHLQIDQGQGYFFSKPVPAEELEHWLMRRNRQ